MLNSNGYTIKELIILCVLVGIGFIISFVRISYAYSDIDNEAEIQESFEHHFESAAKLYVESNKDKFKEEETYFYGSDLIEAQYILDVDVFDCANTKIKVTHKNNSDNYQVEIVK